MKTSNHIRFLFTSCPLNQNIFKFKKMLNVKKNFQIK